MKDIIETLKDVIVINGHAFKQQKSCCIRGNIEPINKEIFQCKRCNNIYMIKDES